ncbi:hypothetical protein D1627_12145 [Pontibacter oryzae]|uniref:Uncharacterized protein n=2 Tax=Pontibacter oryzae TaxID=2304593 RepID=A0A399S8C2_9BACT|nr:hypothetical protein D1627_12145 [Pontibacter oryzae]
MKVRLAAYCSQKVLKYGFSLLLFFLIGTVSGYGQVNHESQAQHDQEVKLSLKEASKVDAAYKETHLNTNIYTFKKGAAGRKRVYKDGRDKYQFNTSGEPVKKLKLFKKKRKYKQRSKKKD